MQQTPPSPQPAGRAAVSLIADARRAFELRIAACRAAESSLDIMAYAWHGDASGQRLARAVWDAAERGVRVRLLLDDLHLVEAGFSLAGLARHPRTELRLYNPFPLSGFGRLGALVTGFLARRRLNHRMHNKAWIIDGRLLIVGGRNVGDAYFDAASQFNFRDLDLVIEGDVVGQAVAQFDSYWSSRRVRPMAGIIPPNASPPSPAPADENTPSLDALLAPGRIELDASRIRLLADPPRKGFGRPRGPTVLEELRRAIRAAREEVRIISPYFVPGGRGARLLGGLAWRGIRVAVLTNSLAATDVLAVHGGYARYRRRLLRAGVVLYELKRGGQEGRSLLGASGAASLHGKALSVDHRLVFVGSFNFDPRSAHLNTEMGAMIEDERLAMALDREFARLTLPEHSWRVEMRGLDLRWCDTAPDGQPRINESEPESSWRRVLLARAAGWLPIEPHL
jgi:putative cardiolipin synthase